MSAPPRVLVDGLAFAEGIRVADGDVWFSDMHDRTVYRVSASDGAVLRAVPTPDRPSGLVVDPGGSVFVTQQESRTVAEIHPDGTLTTFAALGDVAEWHVNDMTTDGRGHLFVGDYGDDSAPPDPPHPAALARVDADGAVSVAAEGLHFANGMAVVDGGATLLVAETRSVPPRISAFPLAPDGTLGERRTHAAFEGARMPDGIAQLPDGSLLVAMPFTAEIVLLGPGGVEVRSWGLAGHGMPYAVAVDPVAGTVFAACSGSWRPEECLRSRDSRVLAFPLDETSVPRS